MSGRFYTFASDGWSQSFLLSDEEFALPTMLWEINVNLGRWHFNNCCVPPSICPLQSFCIWLQNVSNENENCRSTSAALALLLLRGVALVRERDAGRHNAFCTSLGSCLLCKTCARHSAQPKKSPVLHICYFMLHPNQFIAMKHGICIFSTVY